MLSTVLVPKVSEDGSDFLFEGYEDMRATFFGGNKNGGPEMTSDSLGNTSKVNKHRYKVLGINI